MVSILSFYCICSTQLVVFSSYVRIYSQLPIGVLFDMYYGKQRADRRVDNLLSNPPAPASSSSSSSSLSSNPKERVEINDSFSWVGGPWNILIHLRRFPHDQLLRCDNDSIRQLYYHSMKQALHLLHGSTLAFSALTLEHRTDMWNGACSGDYTKFMPGFREVLPLRDAVRLLPVRLIQHGLPTIQKPISVFIPSTESVTTPPTTTATINDGASTVFVEGSKGHVAVGSCERTLGDVINILLPNFMKNDNSDGNNYVLIQGVKVPLNASIFEVWSLLCSADLFLYLVIQSTQS